MKKEISLNGRRVEYTLRKSRRAQRMRLAVYCDGSIVVTAPLGLRQSVVERVIAHKSKWLMSKITFFQKIKGSLITGSDEKDYLRYRESAHSLATERVEHFNKLYQFHYNKINIKNQKTRWGSCSKKGNLNFNYKIALLPEKMADYIIVHELCHLREFNHSRKFWALVEKAIPNYDTIREELNQGGVRLQ